MGAPACSNAYQKLGERLGRLGADWRAVVPEAVIELVQRLPALSVAEGSTGLQLPLTAEQRTVLRGCRRTLCGRDVLLQLPRDGALLPGDRLMDASGGEQVVVVAAVEPLLRVQATTALELLQAAYHLGNRHVALELHEQELLLLEDSVLEQMLESRGLIVSHCQRPFLPEGGAYGGGHSHSHSHAHP